MWSEVSCAYDRSGFVESTALLDHGSDAAVRPGRGVCHDRYTSVLPNGVTVRGHMEASMELTEQVETLPNLEEQVGLSLRAIYAEFVRGDYETGLRVNCDVVGTAKRSDFTQIIVAAYNDSGQLVATDSHLISNESSVGLESVSVFVDMAVVPSKIRIYPKPA